MESNLKNAFKFYRNLEPQNQAIDELEQWFKDNHPDQLEKFLQALLSGVSPEVTLALLDQGNFQDAKTILQHSADSSSFPLHESIVPGGTFTWADVLQHGEHIPADQEIIDNIISLAEQLETAREQIGQPFHIKSWYHPQGFGFKSSKATSEGHHASGDAIEFWVDGYTGKQLIDQLSWWPGGMGTYHYVPYIIHLNIGPYKRWQASYPR